MENLAKWPTLRKVIFCDCFIKIEENKPERINCS